MTMSSVSTSPLTAAEQRVERHVVALWAASPATASRRIRPPPTAADEAAALAEIEEAIEFASRPRSTREIAVRLGRSAAGVNAIERRALERLRRMMRLTGVDVRPADMGALDQTRYFANQTR